MCQWHLNKKPHTKEMLTFSQNHETEEIWEGCLTPNFWTGNLSISAASFAKMTRKMNICDVYSKLSSIYWKIGSFMEWKAFAAVMYFILSGSLQQFCHSLSKTDGQCFRANICGLSVTLREQEQFEIICWKHYDKWGWWVLH